MRYPIGVIAQSPDPITNVVSVIPNADVTVFDRNPDGTSGSAATVYLNANPSDSTPLSQPILTSATGAIAGWLPSGDYNIVIAKAGYTTQAVGFSTPPATAPVTSIIAGTNVTISPLDGLGNVTVNASGGGSGPKTAFFELPPTQNFSHLPNLDWTGGTTAWDDIGITLVNASPNATDFCLPKGYYTATLTISGQDDTPSPATSFIRYTAALPVLQQGGKAPTGPGGQMDNTGERITTVDDSGTGFSFVTGITAAFESGNTDLHTLLSALPVGTFSVLSTSLSIYNLTADHVIDSDGVGFAQAYLYIQQLFPKS